MDEPGIERSGNNWREKFGSLQHVDYNRSHTMDGTI